MIQHGPNRQHMPRDRNAVVHKFSIGAHEGYLHVGLFPDGRPGEIFVKMNKQGSTISGLMDAIALLTSLCLQYGVPLEVLASKMQHTRFEPAGYTGNPEQPHATSVLDYIFRFLGRRFVPGFELSIEPPIDLASDVIATMDPTKDLPFGSVDGVPSGEAP